MTVRMARLDILIVGCSIAGPTLASFLLLSPLDPDQKPRITILERSSAPRAEGQNVDVRGVGAAILRRLGIDAAVRASTTGEEGVELVDRDNRVWVAVPADKTGQAQAPTSDIEILRGRLAEICWKNSGRLSSAAEKEGAQGVEYVFGDYLESLEQNGDKVHVRFAKSKEQRSFDIVVGADGLQSQTRSMVWGAAGEKDRLMRLGMYGAFFSMPPGETDTMWRRWFHASGRRGIMLRPDVQGGRTTVFMTVINDTDSRFDEVALKGRKGLEEQKLLLKECFLDAGWESERVIKEMMATDDFYYDIVGQVKMDSWSKGRVVLLGDAAYCASPISGMGTTLALSGAYTLAGALVHHPSDVGTAFAEYEEKMRPLVNAAQKTAPKLARLVNPQTEWGVWVMHALLWLLQKLGVMALLAQFAGPPADAVEVEEYGFKQPSEWTD